MKVLVIYRETEKQGVEEVDVPGLEKHCGDIIAASPFLKENCTNCYRVVLRYLGKNFVIHHQQVPTPGNDIGIGFSNGNYPTDIREAFQIFFARSMRHFQFSIEELKSFIGK